MKNWLIYLIFLVSLNACWAKHDHMPTQANDQDKESVKDPEEIGEGKDPNDNDDNEEENVLTFKKDILSIIKNRCSICHFSGSGLPFWEDYNVILENKDLVRRRVFEIQDMPKRNITEMISEERELVAMWIDQGAIFE